MTMMMMMDWCERVLALLAALVVQAVQGNDLILVLH